MKKETSKLVIVASIAVLVTVLFYQFIIPPHVVYKEVDEYEAEISRLTNANIELRAMVIRREKLADSLISRITDAQKQVDETTKEMEEYLHEYNQKKYNLIHLDDSEHIRIFSEYTNKGDSGGYSR